MKIVTNNQPRYMISFIELPEKVKADFDYVEEDEQYSDRFVCYRGGWYDVFEMTTINGIASLDGWDAHMGETYFSGVLVKLSDEDQVIMGRYWT